MSMSSVRRVIPLLDRVLIQRVKAQEKTASGILIPEKAQEAVHQGIVKAVGPGSVHPHTGNLVPMSLAVGDKVMLPPYGGSTVKVDGSELLIFREGDILAKLDA